MMYPKEVTYDREDPPIIHYQSLYIDAMRYRYLRSGKRGSKLLHNLSGRFRIEFDRIVDEDRLGENRDE